ncbi:hypothetical protein GYMLUDRAFT_45382 [Collybiopsis luxurians FD-317 M1]|uniref:Unplaced genomic scaffold GYMLUscaffold_38, whole genome shotgun sequence n=1 Tax=Collybiopsis luxurians FD-317 M1 TaxID=944289 RepID=A0A0D0BS77_9AGAR|nr:hypothetical protein GYMLUDRAFT_45382 [Collybiopsis luxurians FD-317 M1]
MSPSVSATRQSFENPKVRIRFGPDVRTYISFSIDLRKTLDLLRCDIRGEFEEAITNFPARKYVAVVQGYPSSLPIPDVPYQQITLRLLQQGLPDAIPNICLEPHMCFPVTPDTSHPLNRPPVKTNKPLPWKECYHLSCLDAEVCLPQSQFDYANAFWMDFNDWLRAFRYCGEDAELARANQGEPQNGWPSWIPCEEDDQDSAHEPSSEDKEDGECSEPPAPQPLSEPLATKQYKYDEDGRIDWLASSDSEDDEDFEEPYEDSGDDSDAYSESIRWLTDDEDGEEEKGSEAADERIPSMNAMLEALMPFDGYLPDGSILPVIDFSPDLSGIPSLFSAEQFFKDFEAAQALLKECVEGRPGSTVSAVEAGKEDPSNTAGDSCAREVDRGSAPQPIRRPFSAFRKRIEKGKDALKASRVGRFFKRVLCRSDTKN